jgi:hypothetical protein
MKKIIIEYNGLECFYNKNSSGLLVVVYCSFNPAKYPLFLDYLGNVERAGEHGGILGYIILRLENGLTINNLENRLNEALKIIAA